MPPAWQGLGPGGGRLSRRRAGRRRAQARGRRGPPRESGHGGRRRRLARVRAQVHVGGDRVGAGRPADRGADRSRPRRVREDGVGGTGAGPLLLDGGPAPRAWRRRACARPRRAVRPGDGPQPEHRAAWLAEDLRPAARRLQPRARLEPPGRPGAGQGAAARPSRLHRGGEAAGRARPRSRPTRVDPRLPGAACRARRGAEPRRRGLRPGGSRLRSAAPRQGLRHRPRSGQRKAVAAERSAVRA